MTMSFFFVWISFVTIMVLGAASPGPDFVITVRNAISHSARAGIMTAIGIGLGIWVHVSYSILGIAALISQSVVLFSIIKYIGAAYLTYIGIKALRSRGYEHKRFSDDNAQQSRPHYKDTKALRDGFLTNLLNPKATLFFLALLPQFLGPETAVLQKIVLGISAGFFPALWFIGIALVLNQRSIRRQYMAFAKWIDRVCGGLLIALGVRLALSK